MDTGSRLRRRTERFAIWSRSLLSPKGRFLPGLGARIAPWPRLAAAALVALRAVPTELLRASVLRNVSVPLVTRMDTWLEVPVTGGFRMRLDASDVSCRRLLTSGVYEPVVTSVFARLLAEGDVCVDVGAHVGYFTLLASRLVGRTGRIYSFEPEAASYEALRSNLALNELGNVTALAVAAGAEDGSGTLHTVPPGNSGRATLRPVRRPREGAAVPVVVRPLASVIAGPEVTRLRLVKVDVEGTEADVLRGMEPLFAAGAHPSVIVELHPAWWSEGTAAYLSDFCARAGLVPYGLAGGDLVGEAAQRGRAPLRFEELSRRQHVLLAAEPWPPPASS